MDRMGRAGGLAGHAKAIAPFMAGLTRLAEWVRRRQMRAALIAVPRAALQDIGLMPEDVEAALASPLTVDASGELAEVAVARATNW
ncbi:hypothetical protein [Rhodobacter sp. SY28-1]|uniref:hypothetical protein n=1 Tax=Rhodobacter sp. SY28-1 TaxID=2562317 RepID=UPI00148502F9|nr:hypothetical protein [Rhodobacter sp. SY28-1]